MFSILIHGCVVVLTLPCCCCVHLVFIVVIRCKHSHLFSFFLFFQADTRKDKGERMSIEQTNISPLMFLCYLPCG